MYRYVDMSIHVASASYFVITNTLDYIKQSVACECKY